MTKKLDKEVAKSNCMHLEQYIELLQEQLKKEGNLPITYAMDDEGNGYSFVRYAPSCVAYEGKRSDNAHSLEIIDIEDALKHKATHFKAICIN